jgi:hypothetical protein
LYAFIGGSATLTNGALSGCTPGFPCHNDAGADLSFGAVGTATTGGSDYPLDFGGLENASLIASIGSDGGTVTLPIPGSGGEQFFSGFFAFPPPPNDAFVGTGQVDFDVSSVLDITDFEADSLDATLDPGQIDATLIYEYNPVVPEPSLLVATGAMSILLVIGRLRRHRVRTAKPEHRCPAGLC